MDPNAHTVNTLQDLYVENYLQPIRSNSQINEAQNNNGRQVIEEKKKEFKKFEKKKKGGKGTTNKERTHGDLSEEEVGSTLYDSVNFDSHFARLLREFDEGGMGDTGGDEFADGADNEYDFGAEDGDEQISVSRATLKSIVDQLKEILGEEEDMEEGLDDEFGDEGDIPVESVYHGDQGTYDGKAKPQPKSKFVKDNGDADFSDQDTGFDPEDTEGHEGAEHGAKGTYDGKAKPQPKSNLVGDNGNANFGKQRTGYGKKEGQNQF